MVSLANVLTAPARSLSLSAIGRLVGRLRLRRKKPASKTRSPEDDNNRQNEAVRASESADAHPPADAPGRVWPDWRIELMERLWGEGFLLPGGEDFVTELAKPLNIGAKASVLVVGSGMGGPARLIAEEFKTFVDGVELDPELVDASNQRATVIGGLQRVKIGHLNYDGIDSFGRKYDAIIGQEALLPLANKQEMIRTCSNDLKTSGKLVMTDFALPDDATVDSDIEAWLKREHTSAAPVSEAEMRIICKETGMIVRLVEDMTERYLKLALIGWSGFEKWFQENSSRRDILVPMLAEAERWNQRINLLKAGKLRYVRLLSIKSKPPL